MRYLWDFVIIVSALPWILRLAQEGYIPLPFAAFILVAFVFLRGLGRGIGGGVSRLIRMLLGIGIPITSLLIFAGISGGGNWQDIGSILGYIIVLLVMLIGFYIMFFGFFSSKRG